MPVDVKHDENVDVYAESIASDKVCPIFSISNVTG
jgi:GTPase